MRNEATHPTSFSVSTSEGAPCHFVGFSDVLKRINDTDAQCGIAVSTGYDELDEMTSGFQPGELVILAARPGMGKTALALNIAGNVASSGKPVAIFSMEMGGNQLVMRMLGSVSGISQHQ